MKAAPQESMPRGTERILFIDDEPSLTDLADKMLGRLGYRITAKTSSVEAFEIFQQNPQDFDLVITDMTMPGMTGYTVAQKIIHLRPDIPIILCSGYNEDISEEKAREIGIRAFFQKPLLIRRLALAIRDLLDTI